ncbi:MULTISPECIES: hypothetical protein [Dietzia]|jgi:hypothetical protein|uniref:Conjugal transfer protein TrbC n=1 Tax=Dietzia cinnamea TaxID=321318 RepID=A0AAW5Q8T0_9ACTN|nr:MULTISPECIES: hypothetical protein [Dietzia]ODQ87494.1 hypothetical protein BFG51_16175 [Dietzia alimentaria]KZO60479.1 hypothetical protein A2U19_01525 [Dietzia maris]MBB1021703.1 hypothetical protein [Dietzia sp. E1]MCT1639880.1 hypothetical protein [Dietzia cinnamea]MCT2031080.1 hypothetical protein [Dietzia cinnamea]
MIVETIHAAAPVAEHIIAVGENLSPMEIPGAGDKVDTALSYAMWGCIAVGILGVMFTGAYFVMARAAGRGDEVQGRVIGIIGGCLTIMLAGPIVNALVS